MFVTKMKLKLISKTKYTNDYVLKADLIYQFRKLLIIVPRGTITDGASIPYPLSKIFKTNDMRYLKGAVLHDHLYDIGYNRYEADKLFYRAMKECDTPMYIRASFFFAVRLFGKKYYKS